MMGQIMMHGTRFHLQQIFKRFHFFGPVLLVSLKKVGLCENTTWTCDLSFALTYGMAHLVSLYRGQRSQFSRGVSVSGTKAP